MFDIFLFYVPHDDERKAARNYALMDLMRASAERVGFTGRLVFYTHESARLPDDLPVSEVKRIAPKNVPIKDIMLLRAYALLDFVSSPAFERPTMSMEADQLFQQDPTSAFNLQFDVGLTYPCWTKKVSGDYGKLNGGVVYINNKNIDAVRNYYSSYTRKFVDIKDELDYRFLRRIDGELRPVRLAEIGGEEITHMRLLPPTAFDNHQQERRTFMVGNTKVMLLESIKFNCQHAERQDDELIIKYYPETIVRHFNSWRIVGMPQFAEEFLGLRLQPSKKTSWGTEVSKVT